MKTRKEHIMNAAKDLASGLLYYDRKEDDDLPVGTIEEAIAAGEVSPGEIVATFAEAAGFDVIVAEGAP